MRFHPDAIAEVRAARIWYSARNIEAGDRFREELKWALDRIRERPETWPAHVHGTHRKAFRRFPYVVVYRIRDEVQVIAIPHHRRRPGYWRTRLSWASSVR